MDANCDDKWTHWHLNTQPNYHWLDGSDSISATKKRRQDQLKDRYACRGCPRFEYSQKKMQLIFQFSLHCGVLVNFIWATNSSIIWKQRQINLNAVRWHLVVLSKYGYDRYNMKWECVLIWQMGDSHRDGCAGGMYFEERFLSRTKRSYFADKFINFWWTQIEIEHFAKL